MVNNQIDLMEKDLSRIIGFTNSCDSKSSIVLSVTMAITTLVVGFNGPLFVDYFGNNPISLASAFLLLALISSVVMILAGTSHIISSLYARMKLDHSIYQRSLIFYGSIASMGYEDYKKSVLLRTEDDYLEDLSSQIHNNSVICNRKYTLYNRGLLLSVVGIVMLLICSGIILFQ